jgi:hypothetical protein
MPENKITPLQEYIDEHYDGNASKFARSFGCNFQNVRRYVAAGYCVINHNGQEGLWKPSKWVKSNEHA